MPTPTPQLYRPMSGLDPDNLPKVLPTVEEARVIGLAVGLAISTAIVRVLYDESETKLLRIALEGVFCGLMTLSVSFALHALDLAPSWSIFSGGLIGSMGAAYVRMAARKIMQRKLDRENDTR